MTAVKQNIRHLGMEELMKYFESVGEKKFRTKQVHEWL
ncbi:MAG: 23S rRNA (adenine(2503)-C(2))-methyltransferase RlmN, partial [Ferruginibacter sp.]